MSPRPAEPSRPKERTGEAQARSTRIAGWLGPVVMAVALSEAKNLHIWATSSAPLTYLVGILWFITGVSIVKVHNRWTAGWPVTITLVGWLLVVGGLFRMFFPEAQQGNQNTPEVATYAFDVVLMAVGALMTYKAYRPPATDRLGCLHPAGSRRIQIKRNGGATRPGQDPTRLPS